VKDFAVYIWLYNSRHREIHGNIIYGIRGICSI
jgi:hypothetical protein